MGADRARGSDRDAAVRRLRRDAAHRCPRGHDELPPEGRLRPRPAVDALRRARAPVDTARRRTRSPRGMRRRASRARPSSAPRPRGCVSRCTCSPPSSHGRASTSESTTRWTWSPAPSTAWRSASCSSELFRGSQQPSCDYSERGDKADPDAEPAPSTGRTDSGTSITRTSTRIVAIAPRPSTTRLSAPIPAARSRTRAARRSRAPQGR